MNDIGNGAGNGRVAVVGAGLSGAVIARELAEAGHGVDNAGLLHPPA